MSHSTQRFLGIGVLALSAAAFGVWQSHPVAAAATTQSTLPSEWNHPRSTSGYTQADLPFATDHILVKMKSGTRMTVSIDSGTALSDALAAWNANPTVDYAETDGLFHTYSQDPSWGYTAVHADTAGTTNSATGLGAKVAVVDTGVDYGHEDLDANNWVNTGETADDGIDNDGNGYVDDVYGYDFIGSLYTAVTPDSDPADENGHGTHVSGIIAAENNTVGTVGVAPSATIMPVKVLDAGGSGWDSTIANGIYYAADNGADVINLSLGSSFPTHTLSDAIDYAVTHGVIVIAAAGNEGSFTGKAYPAQYSNVVSVGSSNEDGYKSYFSNWGKVDVMAPGEDIESTYPGNQYTSLSGTSMASPHVAGIAALIVQDASLTNNPLAVRHILETNVSDFGTVVGPDAIAGQGFVDALAATGTQTTKGYLYADTGWISSNNEDTATVTISLRNTSGAALSGQTVNWTTSLGAVSSASSTTDSNGEATTVLTADGGDGLALITATSTAIADAATMEVAVVPSNVSPETVGVMPYTTDSSGGNYYGLGGGGITTQADTGNVYGPGDNVQFWTYANAWDRETHDNVTMDYSVTDPNGDDVSDLDGTSQTVTVGEDFYGWFFIPQAEIISAPLTIPDDAIDGKYTLTITTTDNDSGDSESRSTNFWIGQIPKILVVYDSGYCSDSPVQGWDLGGMSMCTHTGHKIQNEMEDLGYHVMLWDTTVIGYPTSDDLQQFPAVVWASAGLADADTYDLQTYLDAGGNLLLSSELTASYEGSSGSPSDFLWNYLHARYISEILTPDLVDGVSGGPFDGLTFNTDYYDLNGTGLHDSFYGTEIEVNPADDAEAILSFNQGDSTDMTAGVRVATDTYRAAFLSFGLESINDGTGDSTQSHVLGTLMTWLLGSGPSISSISNSKVLNNADRVITIHGSGFQATGTTEVKLGAISLTNVTVVSRHEIQATVPAGTPKGKYRVKVINPDGNQTTKNSVRVSVGGPIVDSVSAAFASNNLERTITVTGMNFKNGATVSLGTTSISDVSFIDPTQLVIKIPKDFVPGMYDVKVVNPSGAHAKLFSGLHVRVGFDQNLTLGDVNDQVRALEKRLQTYGFFTQTPDKTFDEATQRALLLYQRSLSLETTGLLDFLTRYNLNTFE